MDKKLACHEIALTAARMFVDNNKPEYTVGGSKKLIEDLTLKYIEAYNQAKDIFDSQPNSSNVKVLK